MRFFRLKSLRIQLLIAITLLSGCTTVSIVNPNPQDLNSYKVSSGREVGVATQSGDFGYIKIDTVSEDSITGIDRLGNRLVFSNDQIKHVEVEHLSILKTAGATVATLCAGYLAYVKIMFIGF